MTEAWFSRLTLKRDSAAVAPLIDLLAPRDGGEAMATAHRLMWSVMPEEVRLCWDSGAVPRQAGGAFLWREDEPGRKFYLLGPRPVPESPYFQIETKSFDPVLAAGDWLAFDLRLNATVAFKVGEDENGRAKRKQLDVALGRLLADEREGTGDRGARAGRRLPSAEAAARDWLTRQGERDGFRLVGLTLAAYRVERLPRRAKAKFGISDLRGLVEIVEFERFLSRVLAGFGRAKAFGCGLMLLRRTPS